MYTRVSPIKRHRSIANLGETWECSKFILPSTQAYMDIKNLTARSEINFVVSKQNIYKGPA